MAFKKQEVRSFISYQGSSENTDFYRITLYLGEDENDQKVTITESFNSGLLKGIMAKSLAEKSAKTSAPSFKRLSDALNKKSDQFVL